MKLFKKQQFEDMIISKFKKSQFRDTLHLENYDCFKKKFKLQSGSKFDFSQLFKKKVYRNVASLAIARGVLLQVVTIATKIPGGIDM